MRKEREICVIWYGLGCVNMLLMIATTTTTIIMYQLSTIGFKPEIYTIRFKCLLAIYLFLCEE